MIVPWSEPIIPEKYKFDPKQHSENIVTALEKIILCADIAAKHKIYEQYDHGVMNDTIKAHNIGSAIVRINNRDQENEQEKAIATTCDCTPRYVASNPFVGASQAVIEAYRNLIILGAKPLAITNCLNFGNPEKPEIMGQIVKSIAGISETCKKLSFPVISGNVSLYNETNGKAIQPTPNIGAVGLIENLRKPVDNYFSEANQDIFLLGTTKGELGSSLYLREIFNIEAGDCPEIDCDEELKYAKFVTMLLKENLLTTVNDVSDGGLLTLLTKMSFVKNIAFELTQNNNSLHPIEFYFAEDQARYVLTSNDSKKLQELAKKHDIEITHIGKTITGNIAKVAQEHIDLKELKAKFQQVISF